MPIGLQIFLACGGSTLITLIVTGIYQLVAAKIRKRKEAKDTWKEEVRGLVKEVGEDVKSIRKELDTNKEATVLGLRVQMKDLRDKYVGQGFADDGDKSMWIELYNRYRDMGGNHFREYVDGWKAAVLRLPTSIDNTH